MGRTTSRRLQHAVVCRTGSIPADNVSRLTPGLQRTRCRLAARSADTHRDACMTAYYADLWPRETYFGLPWALATSPNDDIFSKTALAVHNLRDGFSQHIAALHQRGLFLAPQVHFYVAFDTAAAYDSGNGQAHVLDAVGSILK